MARRVSFSFVWASFASVKVKQNLFMKTINAIYALCALCAMPLISSCSDDDDDNDSFSVNPSSVSLNSLDTEQLTTDDGRIVTWSTSDDFVATVDDNGLLKAVHVGEASVTATDSKGATAVVSVTVEPKHNLYVEPCVKWGISKDVLKGIDKREIVTDDDDALLLEAGGSAMRILYTFKDGALNAAAVSVSLAYSSTLAEFLFERYEYLGQYDDYFIFKDNKGLSVILSVTKSYLLVVYSADASSKSLSVDPAEALSGILPADVLASLPEQLEL